MRVAVPRTRPHDRRFLAEAIARGAHELICYEPRLELAAAAAALQALARQGVRVVALRCAGCNNLDLGAAARLGIQVGRAPGDSPNGVAEHPWPCARGQCRARSADGLRPAWPHRRRGRHRAHRPVCALAAMAQTVERIQ